MLIVSGCKSTENGISLLQSKEDKVVSLANNLLGSKYKYGGESPKGFDCSGLTYYVYDEVVDMQLPRRSRDQYDIGKKIKYKNAEAGDLIFFKEKKRIYHVGIVVSNDADGITMIHSTQSNGVNVTNVDQSSYWSKRVAGVKRIL